jgi:hypothetical protein
MEQRRLVTAKALGEILSLDVYTVRVLARKGQIPVYRLNEGPNAHMRFDPEEVIAALKAPGK